LRVSCLIFSSEIINYFFKGKSITSHQYFYSWLLARARARERERGVAGRFLHGALQFEKMS
jgi:hypothetical protein